MHIGRGGCIPMLRVSGSLFKYVYSQLNLLLAQNVFCHSGVLSDASAEQHGVGRRERTQSPKEKSRLLTLCTAGAMQDNACHDGSRISSSGNQAQWFRLHLGLS